MWENKIKGSLEALSIILELKIESVTFKMTHFAFVNKGQIPRVIILILTLIDKCKMCHFECHGLKYVQKFD
jgi:hypothetical protein